MLQISAISIKLPIIDEFYFISALEKWDTCVDGQEFTVHYIFVKYFELMADEILHVCP